MRVAILCNGNDLALWQKQAIDGIADRHEIFILACSEPPAPRRRWRHAAYYALNLASIRNRLTRRVAWPIAETKLAGRIDVEPSEDRGWAVLPDQAIDWLKQRRIDAVVKFGLDLLRIPSPDRLPIPILSFHHGDPRRYRGRPAGFYEMANGEAFVGQVVQILSNALDSGEVVAFTESRVAPHSYRRTLIDAYSLSPYLLPQALAAVEAGRRIDLRPTGCNYRLPGNFAVAAFVTRRWLHRLGLLWRGAFIEKAWKIATCHTRLVNPIDAVRLADSERWETPPIHHRFSFYADPFFAGPDGSILVEALNKWRGKGEIVRLSDAGAELLKAGGGHYSYPATIAENGERYLIPEISEWSAPGIYRLEGNRMARVAELKLESAGLLDPTPLWHRGRVYLFGNRLEDGGSILRLWSAPSLFGKFEEHPGSPIRVSARGSRMAGTVAEWEGSLYRIGQDSRQGYGDGILAFRIKEISQSTYDEELIGEAAFTSVRGPHTVNMRDGTLLFDFYQERFSLLAGIRRLAGRI